MAVNDLIFGGKTFKIQRIPLISQCQSFLSDPSLLTRAYHIRSSVNSDNLRLFISAIEGVTPAIQTDNVSDLALLCEEFGFATLADKVAAFRAQHLSIDEEARQRIQFLEEQNNRLERIIGLIRAESFYQKEEIRRLFQANKELSMIVAQLQEKVAEGPSKGENGSQKKSEYKGDPLNGIISNLTKKCGKNVQDQDMVTVTAKSVYNFTAAKNVADLTDDSWWCSADESDQLICYDFGKMKVKPMHYSIWSHCNSRRCGCNLKSWVLERSVDEKEWLELDQRKNNEELNEKNAMAAFAMKWSEAVRMIRIRQTGENHAGKAVMVISAFEVIGSIIAWAEKQMERKFIPSRMFREFLLKHFDGMEWWKWQISIPNRWIHENSIIECKIWAAENVRSDFYKIMFKAIIENDPSRSQFSGP